MKRKKKPIRSISKRHKSPRLYRDKQGRFALRPKPPKRPVILVHPWPPSLPVPIDAAPGTLALFQKPYILHRKIGRRWFSYEYSRSVYYLLPKPPKPVDWLTAHEYLDRIIAEKTFAGHTITEYDLLYHSKPASDVVHIRSRFVWKVPRFPYSLRIYNRRDVFHMIRVWFWVYPEYQADETQREYQLWCRTSYLDAAVSFADLAKLVQPFYDALVRDIPEQSRTAKTSPQTMLVDGLAAWTGYLVSEKASRTSQYKEGGTDE
jgi:hypothetical protein